MLEYMSLYRTYNAGVPSLLSQYNYADFYLDSIKLVDRQKLVRIYNFDLNSYWWNVFKNNSVNFDFVLFLKFVSKFKLFSTKVKVTYEDLIENINKTYPLIKITFLGQTLIEKLFPVFERCIWLFVPHDAKLVWGVQVILLWLWLRFLIYFLIIFFYYLIQMICLSQPIPCRQPAYWNYLFILIVINILVLIPS